MAADIGSFGSSGVSVAPSLVEEFSGDLQTIANHVIDIASYFATTMFYASMHENSQIGAGPRILSVDSRQLVHNDFYQVRVDRRLVEVNELRGVAIDAVLQRPVERPVHRGDGEEIISVPIVGVFNALGE